MKRILNAQSPEENIQIQPFDVISVPKAELIYVVGNVKKSGGFVLGEREKMTALQALSMAEGFDKEASSNGAKIGSLKTICGKWSPLASTICSNPPDILAHSM